MLIRAFPDTNFVHAKCSGPVTAKLICVFVFAYAKSRFSHDEVQLAPSTGTVTTTVMILSSETKSFVQNSADPDQTAPTLYPLGQNVIPGDKFFHDNDNGMKLTCF